MDWITGIKNDTVNYELIDVKRNTYAVKYAIRDYTSTEDVGVDSNTVKPDCEYLVKYFTGAPNTFVLKELLIASQKEYDKSEEVNSFVIDGEVAWLDNATRIAIKNSCSVLEDNDKSEYTVWLNNKPYILPIEFIHKMLVGIELYAMKCNNATQQHLVNINNLTSRKNILEYQIHTNYPEKVVIDTTQFSIN